MERVALRHSAANEGALAAKIIPGELSGFTEFVINAPLTGIFFLDAKKCCSENIKTVCCIATLAKQIAFRNLILYTYFVCKAGMLDRVVRTKAIF